MSSGTATNAALNKTASADSEEASKGNTADNGNDGDTSTRWCANDGNTGHWWKVDLGDLYDVVGTEVMWEFDGEVYEYKVQVSSGNNTWSTTVDKTDNGSSSQTQQDIFDAESVRYVRIVVTGLPDDVWASFYEFKVFVSSDVTDIEEENALPTDYKSYQNYPNPFNPSTVIKYELPENTHVTLKIYDIIGRKVKTLVDQFQNAGYYSIKFDAENFASGVYIYCFQANDYINVKKMIFLK
ncbi:MAG: discoidin domain-containing protein [Ignavibacteria bacterium]